MVLDILSFGSKPILRTVVVIKCEFSFFDLTFRILLVCFFALILTTNTVSVEASPTPLFSARAQHNMATNGTNGASHAPLTGAAKLRRMIESGEFVAAPGVHDGLSARTVLEVGGFNCIYMVRPAWPSAQTLHTH